MKETDEPSRERLEALRKEISAAREALDSQKALWKNEKDVIVSVQNLKADIEAAQIEEDQATREGDLAVLPSCATAPFLRCSRNLLRLKRFWKIASRTARSSRKRLAKTKSPRLYPRGRVSLLPR